MIKFLFIGKALFLHAIDSGRCVCLKVGTRALRSGFHLPWRFMVPRHGYGIMQFVKELSGGRVILGAGTLYGAINTMLEKGWIKSLPGNEDSRKKEYEITEKGKEIVRREFQRLQALIEQGKRIIGEEQGI
jgi:hypothetical protein